MTNQLNDIYISDNPPEDGVYQDPDKYTADQAIRGTSNCKFWGSILHFIF